MNVRKQQALSILSLVYLALMPMAMAQAQVTVTSADPSSAVQGTISLDVTVNGNGFDSTAQVKFLVTGTADPGGITVKKVAVKGSKRLVATVDVADTAAVNKFDIEVALSNGRKGKGTTLFSVQAKVATGPCASATHPAFAFTTRPGKYQTPQVYVADASGGCTKLVGSLIDGPYYYPWPHRVSYRLLPLAADGRRTGRIATHEQNRGIVLMQFNVDPLRPRYGGAGGPTSRAWTVANCRRRGAVAGRAQARRGGIPNGLAERR